MNKKIKPHPISARVLIFLLFFIGFSAIISGAMMFSAPDGRLMQLPLDHLKGTPFSNYLIPGIILFTFTGIFPVLVGYGLLKQPNWAWPNLINPSKKRHWAWTAAWSAAVIMLIWITVETALLGYISFLQPFVAGYGIIILILTFLPDVQRYYKR